MNEPKYIRKSIVRGDRFRLPLTFTRDVDGFTWENVDIKAQLRDSQNNLIHDFNPTPTIDGATVNCTLGATPSDTENWATGELVMDIEIGANGFGAETPIKLFITVIPDTSTS